MEQERILIEGKNCWRIERARRASFLVDGESYFRAFAAVVERARNSILIAGWDIDSRISLLRDRKRRKLPDALGSFLDTVVSRRPGLRANILIWDSSMIYTFEREPLASLKLGLKTHPRLHFRLDGNHPVGASHHQKIVVVDDSVAFGGGIDLTRFRWDTPAHFPQDERRVDAAGRPYPPFHDVQMIVDDDAAAALGDLFRERWYRAAGERIPVPRKREDDLWPGWLSPDIEDIAVAIARTEPAYAELPGVREVENLYIDAISAARRFIYIENEYLTSAKIGDLLISRMGESDGPEIVLVLARRSTGWLEESTMDTLRARLLRKLREADRFGRLRVYYPHVEGLGEQHINLHAKVLVVDDRLVRIGSSNLSNRSMGLDTECDLAIESHGKDRIERTIALFRSRLLGEHLGVSPEKVMEMTADRGSLIEVVDALRNSDRTLKPLRVVVPEFLDDLIHDQLIDPERPATPEKLIEEFIPQEVRSSPNRHVVSSVVVLLMILVLAGAWQWSSLKDWLDIRAFFTWISGIRGSPMAPVLVIGVYVIGGLIVFPVTLLIVATVVAFGPLAGFIYSFLGCLASGVCLFGLGHLLGREIIDRLAGRRLNNLNRALGHRGLITMLIVRIVPVAPYSIVNLVAGASHIRFRQFIIGTALGLLPGLFAITILGVRLDVAIRHPGLGSFAALAILVAVIVALNLWVRWRLKKVGAVRLEDR